MLFYAFLHLKTKSNPYLKCLSPSVAGIGALAARERVREPVDLLQVNISV